MVKSIKLCTAFVLSLSAIAHSYGATNSQQHATETLAITSLKLIGFNEAQDMVELQGLTSGQTLDLAQFSVDKLNVMADVQDESKTGSVHFALRGPATIDRWENNAVYTMEVETDSLNIQQQELPVGDYTLTVTPYESADMEGRKGAEKKITFTVKDSKRSALLCHLSPQRNSSRLMMRPAISTPFSASPKAVLSMPPI